MQTTINLQKEIFKNRPGVKVEYDRLEPQYALIRQVLDARLKGKMTQKQLAAKMATKQSAIARFEGGDTNPTLEFVQKLATALGVDLHIRVSP